MASMRNCWFAWLLNLLIPGSGHVYYREYSFGVFVFLITLIGSLVFVASYFLNLTNVVVLILLGLPVLFYLVTFIDLKHTAARKRLHPGRSLWARRLFLLTGLLYQALSPAALVNFGWQNAPHVFVQPDNDLAPRYSQGDMLKASGLAYKVRLSGLKGPLLHALPQRYAIVRYYDESGKPCCGVVIGLPGERIEVAAGVLLVNEMPVVDGEPLGIPIEGDWPLTTASPYSILVAGFHLGHLEQVSEVPLEGIIGKVSRLL